MQPNSQRPGRRNISTDGFLTATSSHTKKKSTETTPKRSIGGPIPKKDGFTARPSIVLPNQKPIKLKTGPRKPLILPKKADKNPPKNNFFKKIFSRGDKPKLTGYKRILKWGGLSLATTLVIFGGLFGWRIYRSIAHITNNNNPFSLFGAFSDTKLKGQDSGRVNILLAGNSTDDPGHAGASLIDSMMVLSIDTKNNQAFIISIPRDLWVNIPSLGYEKINATGTVTDFKANGYPDGGMGQLEKTLHDYLGLDVGYYALINYTAFRDMVNAVGGISVNIESTDSRGLYDPNISKAEGGPLKLSNGWQQLNGQAALNLARARGDNYYAYGFPASDFDRTNHQRQMLLALKDKASTLSLLTDSTKITNLFDAISKNVTTDLKLNEIVALYKLTKDIDPAKIQSYNLNNINDQQLLVNYTSPSGQSALSPAAGVDDFTAIKKVLQKLMSSDPLVQESAKVVVLNASDVTGLAKQEGQKLDYIGMTISAVNDAPDGYSKTMVVNNAADKPSSLSKLQNLFGVTASSDQTLKATYPNADFIVVLGADRTWNQ